MTIKREDTVFYFFLNKRGTYYTLCPMSCAKEKTNCAMIQMKRGKIFLYERIHILRLRHFLLWWWCWRHHRARTNIVSLFKYFIEFDKSYQKSKESLKSCHITNLWWWSWQVLSSFYNRDELEWAFKLSIKMPLGTENIIITAIIIMTFRWMLTKMPKK